MAQTRHKDRKQAADASQSQNRNYTEMELFNQTRVSMNSGQCMLLRLKAGVPLVSGFGCFDLGTKVTFDCALKLCDRLADTNDQAGSDIQINW
ncbi:hypothetical protein E2P81_ATG04679 [Venturia nashicola]|nr:hypothetical protein E2P81_ATG04679 [Venturia nashicola]